MNSLRSVETAADDWSPAVLLPLIDLLAHRWVLELLCALDLGPTRPSVLSRRLGVSHKSLTDTLRHMMAFGLVTRTVIAAVPAEVDYDLTARARALWPGLHELHHWISQLDTPAPDPRTPKHPDQLSLKALADGPIGQTQPAQHPRHPSCPVSPRHTGGDHTERDVN